MCSKGYTRTGAIQKVRDGIAKSLYDFCIERDEFELLVQWDKQKNGDLTPQMVTAGSHKKVWWQCAEGHVWKAVIYSRAGPQKCGYPVCSGKVKGSRQIRYADIMTERLKNK